MNVRQLRNALSRIEDDEMDIVIEQDGEFLDIDDSGIRTATLYAPNVEVAEDESPFVRTAIISLEDS